MVRTPRWWSLINLPQRRPVCVWKAAWARDTQAWDSSAEHCSTWNSGWMDEGRRERRRRRVVCWDGGCSPGGSNHRSRTRAAGRSRSPWTRLHCYHQSVMRGIFHKFCVLISLFGEPLFCLACIHFSQWFLNSLPVVIHMNGMNQYQTIKWTLS